MLKEAYLKKISVDELPKYTPWVERLLHLKPFTTPNRNLAKIDAEYDKDKYAKLLVYYKEHPDVTVTDIVLKESSPNSDMMCFSKKGELFLTTTSNLRQLQDKILIDALAEPVSRARVVVELGCGYGYNLSVLNKAFPGHTWLGGEYSSNAVELAKHLFSGTENISVQPFNWYDDEWAILENLQEKALVFTRHTIEQLPSAKSIIPNFSKYKTKIHKIVHLEPVHELIDKRSTLGLMRQAYMIMNDYNTDLLSTIKNMKAQIIETDADLLGANPLNPTSLVSWKFTGKQ